MDPRWPTNWTSSRLVRLMVLTLAYFATATLGLSLSMPDTNATAIWVPTGLAMAAVLRYGPGVWPAILLGAFAANGLILARLGLAVVPLLGASLATAIGNVAEALLAGFLVERFTGTRHPFDRVKHVLQFILVGAILATAVSALVGTAAFCAVTGRWQLFGSMGPAWWLGDAVGALVVAPFLLTFRSVELFSLPFKIHRDALLAGILILAFWFGICPLLPPLAFFFFPLLVLGTSRLGSFYASALVALLAILGTTATLWGSGPFLLPGTRNAALLLQQGFIGTLAITTLVLAAALQERRSLVARLRLNNRLYRTLSEVNQAIVRAEDRPSLLREACRLLVDVGGFRMAWVGSRNEATGRVVPEASAGFAAGSLDDIVIRWDDSPEGRGPTGQALREGRGVVFRDCLHDPAFAPWHAMALAQDFQTCCAFPIRQGGTVSAALMACHSEPNAIGAEDGRLLEELAGDLGYALAALETRMDLAESERRLRTTMENVKLLATALGADHAIGFCNDHLLQLTGWARAEVLGRNWFDVFVPPEARGEIEAVLTPSPDSGEVQIHHENEILSRSGERRLIRWNNTTLRDREGAIIGTASLGEDITDQKRAEAALVQRATELSTLNALSASLSSTLDLSACAHAALEGILSATSPDLALLFLREGETLRLMDSVTATTGLLHKETPTHVVGQCLCGLGAREGRALYAMDIATDSRCTWDECKRSGVKSFAVLPLKTGDEVIGVLGLASASQRDFKAQATFLETLAAQVAAGIQNALLHQRLKAHAADLERCVEERTTSLRSANVDLAKAVERALAADRAKSAFLSAMSHELRTPLNSVIGFTGVLLGGMAGKLLPQQEEPLRIVQRNGRHLLDLINDVLDLSKIEATEMRLAVLPFDLVQTLQEAMESMAPAVSAKSLLLKHTFAVESLPVVGDRRRLAQILLNLLSNAVKFTESGTITLSLSVNTGLATIAIQDTGPGIAPQDLPRLFREFEQLDVGLSRRNEGTGLGLALSRRLARLMGGNIFVESQLGQGSTFILILPLIEQ